MILWFSIVLMKFWYELIVAQCCCLKMFDFGLEINLGTWATTNWKVCRRKLVNWRRWFHCKYNLLRRTDKSVSIKHNRLCDDFNKVLIWSDCCSIKLFWNFLMLAWLEINLDLCTPTNCKVCRRKLVNWNCCINCKWNILRNYSFKFNSKSDELLNKLAWNCLKLVWQSM